MWTRRRPTLTPNGTLFALGLLMALGASACRSTGTDNPVEPGPGTATGGTGSTSGTTGTAPGTTSANPDSPPPDGLRFIGRVPTDANTLSWSGSAVEIHFNGTHGDMQFTAVNGNNYVGLSVDGGNMVRTPVPQSASIAFGPLAQGNHIVRATKLNEARLGALVFNGYTTDGNAMLAADANRHIEFIGDSITAAYGIDGNAPCSNTAALENATASFASVAATALGADASLIAWAGKGVLRNDTSDANTTQVLMPNLWPRYNAVDANSVYSFPQSTTPQVVVIALGTNDYEYAADGTNSARATLDQNAFVASYISFINTIQVHYPAAKFVLCSSPMLSDTYPTAGDAQHQSLYQNVQTVAQHFGASTVATVNFSTLTTDMATGCGGHPNAAAHQAMGTQLASAIAQLMGW